MQTVTIKIYKFAELSEEAKEKAIERMRETEFYHSSGYFDTVKKGLDAFNCSLSNYSIDFDNINSSDWTIKFGYDDEVLGLSGLRLRKWLINNICQPYMKVTHERKPYGKYFKDTNGKWRYPRRSKIFVTETTCPFTGVCMDENFLDPIRKFLKQPDNSTTLEELIKECVWETFNAACNEWEYMQSEEYTIENIENNNYDFTEDGEEWF